MDLSSYREVTLQKMGPKGTTSVISQAQGDGPSYTKCGVEGQVFAVVINDDTKAGNFVVMAGNGMFGGKEKSYRILAGDTAIIPLSGGENGYDGYYVYYCETAEMTIGICSFEK